MRTSVFTIVAALLILSGCAELTKMMQTAGVPAPLTETEVSGGLKEALTTGAKIAAQKLSAENGYYGDLAEQTRWRR